MNYNGPIDICVVTYNRLAYLKNCVWSILASTKIDYRLTVISDNSSDGTNEWLKEMKAYGKIDTVIINEENLGSPKTINRVIRSTKSDIVAVISDDIYVHRGWDHACLKTFKDFNDCGMVSFWNYPTESRHKKVNSTTYKIQSIGVAALMITRELFDSVGGYTLPADLKMGYFSRIFCKKAAGANVIRKHQYLLADPNYAEQMDRNNPIDKHLPKPILNQEYLYSNYNKRRGVEKTRHKKLKE